MGTRFNEGKHPNISVFDLNGRIVYSKQAKANQVEINIESLSLGTYIVKADEQAFKLIKS
ncbi:T9SS type A sorting domain-containing protein [Croceimicrobium hydrocarbonivorans]|uniref:T9SS type A sorting domain-containing protein n=1 Tax=Croceimicrobium hydrocarbonivorans TaxID=2761580 RepID=A0A7H0VK31_9FLAO|nr:T9SS type A sorting domain-containing protein [Croceimicrobium hydrocarbonivorans]